MAENLVSTSSLTRDNLVVGQYPIITEKATILSGQNIVRGTLLGKITKATSAVVPGTNTGNGAIASFTLGKSVKIGNYIVTCISQTKNKVAGTPAPGSNAGTGTISAVTLGSQAQVGTYQIVCIEKVTNKGNFKIITPYEERLDDAEVGTAYVSDHINFTLSDGGTDFEVGDEFTVAVSESDTNGGVFSVVTPDGERLKDATTGVAYSSNHVNFTIADGSTDFVVGDSFTLPVVAGSGKRIKSLAAAVDGSQDPESVAVSAVDASLADKTSIVYIAGQFNKERVTFGTGHTYSSTKDGLRGKGIYLAEASTQD